MRVHVKLLLTLVREAYSGWGNPSELLPLWRIRGGPFDVELFFRASMLRAYCTRSLQTLACGVAQGQNLEEISACGFYLKRAAVTHHSRLGWPSAW